MRALYSESATTCGRCRSFTAPTTPAFVRSWRQKFCPHSCRLSWRRRAAATDSVRQALAHQPLLDHLGDLVAILFVHQHVGIAFDADVGKVDPFGSAAGLVDGLAVGHVEFLEGRPARVPVNVVAKNLQNWHVL